MKSHRFAIVILIIGLTAGFTDYLYITTHGSFKVDVIEMNGKTDGMVWEQLLRDRFDIGDNVNSELFYRHDQPGKYYTYFGIFPGILRGLFTPFYASSVCITRLTCAAAALLIALAHLLTGFLLGLHRGKVKIWFLIYAVSILFASPIVTILSPAYHYTSTILWAGALVSFFNMVFMTFLNQPQKRVASKFGWMGFLCGATFMTRTPSAIGPFAVMCLLFLMIKENWKPKVLMFSIFAVFFFAQLFVNYEKFGSPFSFVPASQMVEFLYRPEGLKKYEEAGGHFNPRRLLSNFEYYFLPHADNFSTAKPYIFSGDVHDWYFDSKFVGYEEPGTKFPLTLTCPLLVLSFFAASAFLFRNRSHQNKVPEIKLALLFLCGSLTSWLFMMAYSGLCLRYTGDFVPLMVSVPLVGLYIYGKSQRVSSPKTLGWVALGVTLISVVICHLIVVESSLAFVNYDLMTKETIRTMYGFDLPLPEK